MRALNAFSLLCWLVLLTSCAPPTQTAPPLETIRDEIAQRFHAAYGELLAVSDIALSPARSTLNTDDHRVYDVRLTAVVQRDLQQALDALPDNMENALARGRIKGIMTLGAVRPGQKITTRLRALVERDPRTGTWSVVGLIRADARTQASQER